MKTFAYLLPPGEGGAKRRMRARQRFAEQLYYKLTTHALIRPTGTPYQVRGRLFSRGEKEKHIAFAPGIYA